MLNYILYGVKITIQAEPGIYIFDGLSATGKTRLFKLLRLLAEDDTSIFTYTREDEQKGLLFEPKGKIKVVMMDRFDVLENQHEQQLMKLAKKAIVLVDCKRECLFDECEGCILNMTVDSIEVKSSDTLKGLLR